MVIFKVRIEALLATKCWSMVHDQIRRANLSQVVSIMPLLRSWFNEIIEVNGSLLHWAASRGHLADLKDKIAQGALADAQNTRQQTPLHLAAAEGHCDVINYLLDQGAFIEAKDENDRTPLLAAAAKGQVEVVQLLRDRKADAKVTTLAKETALHLAAAGGHVELLKLLLNLGLFDVNGLKKFEPGKECPQPMTPLELGAFYGHTKIVDYLFAKEGEKIQTNQAINALFFAVRKGHLDLVELILNYKKTDSKFKSLLQEERINSPLVEAAAQGNLALLKALVAAGASFDEKKRHFSPLHLAAQRGHTEVVKFLVEKWKDAVHLMDDEFSQTPLHYACQKGHLETVEALLAAGAKVANTKDLVWQKTRSSSFNLAARNGHIDVMQRLYEIDPRCLEERNSDSMTTLHQVTVGDFATSEKVAEVLLNMGAKVNARHWGYPPFIALVKLLSQEKINTRCWWYTPIHFACEGGNLELVRLFLKKDPASLNRTDFLGNRPLHIAAQKGHVAIVEYLIKEGAHKTAWNYSLLKAVDLAAINNHQEIVQRLLEKDSSAEAQKALKAIKVRPLVLLNRLIIAPALFLVYLILLPIGAVIDVIDPAVLLVMLVMLVSALIANKVKGDVSVFRGKPVENNKLNTRTHQLKVKDEGENVDLKPNVSVDTIPTSLKAHKPS